MCKEGRPGTLLRTDCDCLFILKGTKKKWSLIWIWLTYISRGFFSTRNIKQSILISGLQRVSKDYFPIPVIHKKSIVICIYLQWKRGKGDIIRVGESLLMLLLNVLPSTLPSTWLPLTYNYKWGGTSLTDKSRRVIPDSLIDQCNLKGEHRLFLSWLK